MDGTTEWHDALLKDACVEGCDDEDASDDSYHFVGFILVILPKGLELNLYSHIMVL